MLYLFLLCCGSLAAQNYYVVKIKGELYANEKQLAPKDQLTADTEIRFVGAGSEAYLMSPTKGFFTLSAKEQYPEGKSEFFVALRDALLPPSQFNTSAIRSQDTLTHAIHFADYYEVMDYFRGPILYTDTLRFSLDEDFFTEEAGHFQLTIHHPTGPIQQTFPEGTFELSIPIADSLLAYGKTLNYELSYEPVFSEDPDLVAEPFQLHDVPPEEVRQELLTLREVSPALSDAAFLEQYALPYVEMRFGKVSPGWVRQLLTE